MGRLKVLALAGVAALVLVATGCGGGGDGGGDTLVFGTAADPTALDGALISDGESIRALYQMTEGLTRLEPGGSKVIPSLAVDWTTSDDGLAWTFNLREDVTFHDGEPFNADAVCFNFDRWFNFPAALQGDGTTYYWQYGFGGGFKNPAEGSPGPEASLYKSCEAVDDQTVTINLTKPSATILSTLSLPSLAIVSPKALTEYDADAGSQNADGIFQPSGTYATEHPTGTGPYKFESWTLGEQLVLVRNDDYWGDKAKTEKIIFRPIADNTARLQALQTGEIQGYDLVEPQDVETIQGDDNLQLLERPPFNVGYVGINQAKPPMDNLLVRQAVAHALNRQEVVDSFYAGRGVLATQFMPQEIQGYADDVTTYDYDPAKSKQLLQQAGLTLPVEIEFWYPTDVSRDYMPDPKRNFEAFAADLNGAGFKVVPKTAPWRPDFVSKVNDGHRGPAVPHRLDRGLRGRGQLHRDVLPGAFRAVRLHEPGDPRPPEPGRGGVRSGRSGAAVPGGEPEDHGLPPGGPVREREGGPRVRQQRPGLRPEPRRRRRRVVRHGVDERRGFERERDDGDRVVPH